MSRGEGKPRPPWSNDMGNTSSSNNHLSTERIDNPSNANDDIFKVDNINSYGRKHASAKIHVSNDSLCIRQKHRQSLHIPLETIKRYGLDGSIFILECGRRAPLGPARYAFRCKQAHRLVDCLDQRIIVRSKQLLEQQRRSTAISTSSTLTNVSSSSRQHHHRRRRRTQSDQGAHRRTVSSILFSSSSSSSSVSLTSRATFSYRNSEPNLSENYVPFDILPYHREISNDKHSNHEEANSEERPFVARLKSHVEKEIIPELNYVELKSESMPATSDDGMAIPSATSTKESLIQHSPKRAILSLFTPQQQQQPCSNQSTVNNHSGASASADISTMRPSSRTMPYVYIDHDRTVTLKEIANERQQQARRMEV